MTLLDWCGFALLVYLMASMVRIVWIYPTLLKLAKIANRSTLWDWDEQQTHNAVFEEMSEDAERDNIFLSYLFIVPELVAVIAISLYQSLRS